MVFNSSSGFVEACHTDSEMEGDSSNQSRPVCTEGWLLLPSAEHSRVSGAYLALCHTLGSNVSAVQVPSSPLRLILPRETELRFEIRQGSQQRPWQCSGLRNGKLVARAWSAMCPRVQTAPRLGCLVVSWWLIGNPAFFWLVQEFPRPFLLSLPLVCVPRFASFGPCGSVQVES